MITLALSVRLWLRQGRPNWPASEHNLLATYGGEQAAATEFHPRHCSTAIQYTCEYRQIQGDVEDGQAARS
jgi:hypothetical protein